MVCNQCLFTKVGVSKFLFQNPCSTLRWWGDTMINIRRGAKSLDTNLVEFNNFYLNNIDVLKGY